MIRNDVYRGARVYGRTKKIKTAAGTRSKRPRPETARTIKEAAHPAIIDPTLWERVKTRREAVAKAYRESGHHFGPTRSVQTQFLLTGLLKCAVCGANFAARVAHTQRGGGRYYYYGCAYRARRGTAVCQNATLLPQAPIEREVLEILQQAVLTPVTLERLLTEVNARLRAQVTVSRPRIKELRKALMQVDREIANYTRAIAKGDFSSLEQALEAALASRKPILGTVLQAPHPWIDGLKRRPRVELYRLTERNREDLKDALLARLQSEVRS